MPDLEDYAEFFDERLSASYCFSWQLIAGCSGVRPVNLPFRKARLAGSVSFRVSF